VTFPHTVVILLNQSLQHPIYLRSNLGHEIVVILGITVNTF